MAFELEHCIANNSNCDSITVTDTTGAYSASNPTGWGADATISISAATAATITISKRETDGTFTDAPTPTVSVFTTLPSNEDESIDLTAEDFGYGTDSTFSDGVYRSVYNVVNDSGSNDYDVSSTIYFTITCSIDCCIQNAAKEASTCTCDCGEINQTLADLQLNRRLLDGAIRTGNLDDVQKYIDKLTKLCSDCACGCN